MARDTNNERDKARECFWRFGEVLTERGHEDWMRRAGGAVEVLELASYPAILACVAAGRRAALDEQVDKNMDRRKMPKFLGFGKPQSRRASIAPSGARGSPFCSSDRSSDRPSRLRPRSCSGGTTGAVRGRRERESCANGHAAGQGLGAG